MEVLWTYALLALTTAPPLLPNSALLVTAGILASRGTLDLAAVLLVVAGSALLGDAVMHRFGRRFSAPVQGWADRSDRRRAFMDWTTARIRRHGVPFVIVVRFLPSGRPAGAIAAGVLRYPTRRYLVGAGIAEAVWATYSVGLGYVGSAAWDSPFRAAAVGLGASALVAGAGGLIQLTVRSAPRVRTSARPETAAATAASIGGRIGRLSRGPRPAGGLPPAGPAGARPATARRPRPWRPAVRAAPRCRSTDWGRARRGPGGRRELHAAGGCEPLEEAGPGPGGGTSAWKAPIRPAPRNPMRMSSPGLSPAAPPSHRGTGGGRSHPACPGRGGR